MDNTSTYTQLSLMTEAEMTPEQAIFMQVHTEMIRASERAAESLLILAHDMKRMRDEQLYKAAGFAEFKDYVQTALNIKERHAYNYISLLELAPDYLKANAGLGVTKLALLAGASDEVREQLMHEEKTAELSVRELTAKIKEQEDALAKKEEQITFLEEKIDDYQNNALSTDFTEIDQRVEELEREKKNAEEARRLAEQLAEAAQEKVKELEAAVENQKSQPAPEPIVKKVTETVEVQVDKPETLQELKQLKKELSSTKKQLAVASPLITEFKVKFEDLQRVFVEAKEIISSMEKADADKCRNALKTIISGWEV